MELKIVPRKVVTVEIYERDLEAVNALIPNDDEFKEKLRVLLVLAKEFEESLK
jgi:hypothetical protein